MPDATPARSGETVETDSSVRIGLNRPMPIPRTNIMGSAAVHESPESTSRISSRPIATQPRASAAEMRGAVRDDMVPEMKAPTTSVKVSGRARSPLAQAL